MEDEFMPMHKNNNEDDNDSTQDTIETEIEEALSYLLPSNKEELLNKVEKADNCYLCYLDTVTPSCCDYALSLLKFACIFKPLHNMKLSYDTIIRIDSLKYELENATTQTHVYSALLSFLHNNEYCGDDRHSLQYLVISGITGIKAKTDDASKNLIEKMKALLELKLDNAQIESNSPRPQIQNS